jgi:hypothetical protein
MRDDTGQSLRQIVTFQGKLSALLTGLEVEAVSGDNDMDADARDYT